MQMTGTRLVCQFGFGLALLASGHAFAQEPAPLTKTQAVAIALEKNPFHKIAVGDERAAEAGISMAQAS